MLRRVLRAGGAGGLASQSSNTGPTPGVEEEQDNGVQPQEDDGYRNSISNNSKVDDRADSSSRPQQQLIFILERTTAGRWLDLLDATVNLSFVGIYIYSTFAAGSPSEAGRTPDGSDVNWIDMTVAALLLSLWLFRAYFSMDPLRKFISTFGLMNLLAELPPLIRPLVVTPAEHQNPTFMDAGRLVLLYPFRFWRLHISLMLCVQPG